MQVMFASNFEQICTFKNRKLKRVQSFFQLERENAQAALVVRSLAIRGFDYSRTRKRGKPQFQPKLCLNCRFWYSRRGFQISQERNPREQREKHVFLSLNPSNCNWLEQNYQKQPNKREKNVFSEKKEKMIQSSECKRERERVRRGSSI